jgi:hypothetical protein
LRQEEKKRRKEFKENKKYAKKLEEEFGPIGESDKKRPREGEEEEQVKEARARSQVGECVPGSSADGGDKRGKKRGSDVGREAGEGDKKTRRSGGNIDQVVWVGEVCWEISQVEAAEAWLEEIKGNLIKESEGYDQLGEGIWEDVEGQEGEKLPWDKVYAARSEEVGFMMERGGNLGIEAYEGMLGETR